MSSNLIAPCLIKAYVFFIVCSIRQLMLQARTGAFAASTCAASSSLWHFFGLTRGTSAVAWQERVYAFKQGDLESQWVWVYGPSSRGSLGALPILIPKDPLEEGPNRETWTWGRWKGSQGVLGLWAQEMVDRWAWEAVIELVRGQFVDSKAWPPVRHRETDPLRSCIKHQPNRYRATVPGSVRSCLLHQKSRRLGFVGPR